MLLAIEAREHESILLDFGLPRHDGLELLRQARGKGVTTPAIMVTARDAAEDRVAGPDPGADE